MKHLWLIPLLLSTLACSLQVPQSLQTSGTTGYPVPLAQPTQAEVTAMRSLNVRKLPGETHVIEFTLWSGESVQVRGSCTFSGWVWIHTEHGSGWVNADFLSGSPCEN